MKRDRIDKLVKTSLAVGGNRFLWCCLASVPYPAVKGAPQSVTPQTPAGPGLPYARQLLLRWMGIFLVFFGSRDFILARPQHLLGGERRGLSAALETRVSGQRRATHTRCSVLTRGLHSCCETIHPPKYCRAVFLVSLPFDEGVLSTCVFFSFSYGRPLRDSVWVQSQFVWLVCRFILASTVTWEEGEQTILPTTFAKQERWLIFYHLSLREIDWILFMLGSKERFVDWSILSFLCLSSLSSEEVKLITLCKFLK